MNRKELKGVKSKWDPNDTQSGPEWTCGDDVPISWEPEELRRMRKKTLRQNYKNGYFTKSQYKNRIGDCNVRRKRK